MAPNLIFTYFDMSGAAEPVRWAMELAGLEWTDRRLSKEDFAALKPRLPNGQVPVLDVDGFQLPQSMAILRYVGKLGGLYPTNDLEAAKCDAIMDSTIDFSANVFPSMYEKDEGKKMEIRAELAANFVPKWLANMEKQLSAAEGTYFADKITVADIMVAFRIVHLKSGSLDGIPTTIVDSCPCLCALHASVMAEPKIVAFVAKHQK